MSESKPTEMTLAQLGHRIGLQVEVNLEGMTVGGRFFDGDHWVSGEIIGVGALGNSLTIQLDSPIGGASRGLLGRRSKGQGTVSVDDTSRIRLIEASAAAEDEAHDEVARLVAEGETLKAIARYRALSGATLEEARAYIARL